MTTTHSQHGAREQQDFQPPHTQEQSAETNNGTADRSQALSHSPHLTTDELAVRLGLHAQSIRKRYSQTGSYFQLRPIKLPNRRLLWPADALERLIKK